MSYPKPLLPFSQLEADRYKELAANLHVLLEQRDREWKAEVERYRDALAKVQAGVIDIEQVMFTDDDFEVMSLDLVMPEPKKESKNGKSSIPASTV